MRVVKAGDNGCSAQIDLTLEAAQLPIGILDRPPGDPVTGHGHRGCRGLTGIHGEDCHILQEHIRVHEYLPSNTMESTPRRPGRYDRAGPTPPQPMAAADSILLKHGYGASGHTS